MGSGAGNCQRCWIPWSWNYRQCDLKWMLGIELWSSEAAVCALNHGALSPGPEKQIFLILMLIAGYSGPSLLS